MAGSFLAIRRDPDVLSCLSTLSLTAMAVVFHLMYDFVVLVIPLCYALLQGRASVRAKGYLLTVGIIWFLDKFVEKVAELAVDMADLPTAVVASVMDGFFWVTVVAFYGTLFMDWWVAFQVRGQRAAPARPAPAASPAEVVSL
jgi:hypothetical protein